MNNPMSYEALRLAEMIGKIDLSNQFIFTREEILSIIKGDNKNESQSESMGF